MGVLSVQLCCSCLAFGLTTRFNHTNTGIADLEGSYVDDLLSRVMVEDPQHGQLSTDGLA